MSEPGKIISLVLREVASDYANPDAGAQARETARQFVEGHECEHLVCGACTPVRSDQHGYTVEGDWFASDCSLVAEDLCRCGHRAASHFVATFDWGEWRDYLCSLVGINPEFFATLVRG